jgi:hypothetical protein
VLSTALGFSHRTRQLSTPQTTEHREAVSGQNRCRSREQCRPVRFFAAVVRVGVSSDPEDDER